MSVNVFTEWGKLKEIIVGSVISPNNKIITDLSFKLFYHDNINNIFLDKSIDLQKRLIEQREEDLNNLANTLKSHGIIVHRPEALDQIIKYTTPDFEAYMRPCDNPRDQVLIVGDTIIETPVLNRARLFETNLIKPILLNYFKHGAKWICAPRPTLRDESFDLSYVNKFPRPNNPTFSNHDETKFEIMFDAAQCLKFGKDIIMNISTANHQLGFKWLSQILGAQYRVHPVEITDHHIDGMMMPLRPGTLLVNPKLMQGKINLLPKPLQKWDILLCPDEEFPSYSDDVILLASDKININILPIDEKNILVFNEYVDKTPKICKLLQNKGFNPIPIRLRHSRVFDGGIHCATLDTVREDSYEDYFC